MQEDGELGTPRMSNVTCRSACAAVLLRFKLSRLPYGYIFTELNQNALQVSKYTLRDKNKNACSPLL